MRARRRGRRGKKKPTHKQKQQQQQQNNDNNNDENLQRANPVLNCAKRCTVIHYILTENEQEKDIHTYNY